MIPFLVHLQPGIPIYEQIVLAVKKAVATGQLKPGEQMPSVRVISRDLSINPNTVQKAISRLTDEGVLVAHPGQGCFVTERRGSHKEDQMRALEPLIERLVIQAAHHGVSEEQLLLLIQTQIKRIYESDH